MWQPIQIEGRQYFLKTSKIDNNICCYLYDLKEVLVESCSVEDAFLRAKELNKRIIYDNETVLKTICFSTPTTVILECVTDVHKLYIKYHVARRPFNFEWSLKSMSTIEIHNLITYPLFVTVHSLMEQISELKDMVKKKDAEIEQYKLEGAVLQRTTVSTSPFQEEYFDYQYCETNRRAVEFSPICEKVRITYPGDKPKGRKMPKQQVTTSSTMMKREEMKTDAVKTKKREFIEKRRRHLENIVKAKKEKIEYQSSQSQTPPTEELADIFQSLDELNAKRLASTNL